MQSSSSRPQQQLIGNWVGIVLTVVSIIQGLAFNNLLNRFPEIYSSARMTGDYLLLLHFSLCFIILLRIFQTYVTAVLHYNFGLPSFSDIFIVFGIGAIEYFLFSSLTVPFNMPGFHKRGLAIAIVALIAYVIAIYRVAKSEEMFFSYGDYAREIRLQVANIGGVVVVIALASVMIGASNNSYRISFTLVAMMTLTVIFNTIYSIHVTFHRRPLAIVAGEELRLDRTARKHGPRLDVDITKPDRDDLVELSSLLVAHFGYVYNSLFDTSERLTFQLLKCTLAGIRGKHAFGYRAFHIARCRVTGETVALLFLKTATSDRNLWTYLGVLAIARSVLLRLGVLGLFRTCRNWQLIGRVVPQIDASEMHVVYLAVKAKFQGRQIGKQLLEYAKGVAMEEGKVIVGLYVRESNGAAQQFFLSQGFALESTLSDAEADARLGQGASLRMILRLQEQTR